MNRLPIALIGLALLVAGCEPERGIRSNRDYPSTVDANCVDRALRTTFGQIERWDYVSDGGTFSKGTPVAQFAYYHTSDRAGWATLEIGAVENGTRISHAFTGIGSELPQSTFPPALTAMRQASDALGNACHLNLAGMEMRKIGQDVDALN